MAIYRNTRQLYVCAEQLFYRIQEEDPKAGDALLASRLVIRLRCTEPDGVILINGRSRPIHASFGSNSVNPDLDIEGVPKLESGWYVGEGAYDGLVFYATLQDDGQSLWGYITPEPPPVPETVLPSRRS